MKRRPVPQSSAPAHLLAALQRFADNRRHVSDHTPLEKRSLTSLKQMMGFILAIAAVLWAVVTLLRDLVAGGVL
jgi:hypothetical protein